ncbi:MAG: methyltransferase domain-containing protein [Atribacterota bacterium]|jgi:protein-L-isoaspartate(D-aspartate) O-methyltransferase|nr:methyltransferase domain-containing protein [Atribacterota bacterium]MDD4895691.1 methyltransferase domain-containing protein [Atribacterota bacterium]MDD5638157.1 methyltransferase domain-containing protein [Atribacterota bacterium]
MNREHLVRSVKNNLSYLAASSKEKDNLNRIISAIQVVDRVFFVRDKEDAYFDTALPIGYNQTISQPSTVARMLMIAELESGKNLLELGAGSGWNASLAGFLIHPGKVLSLDIVPQLIEKAQGNLNNLKRNLNYEDRGKLSNIEFKLLNILKQLNTWQEQYDRIIITAGINKTQENLIFQLAKKVLKEKGILVCPYTHGPLIILKKENSKVIKDTTMEQYVFVPLLD